MATTKIRGENFRVFVGGSGQNNAVVEATSCNVTISGETESQHTKDSTNLFDDSQVTSKSWSVQVDSYDSTAETLRKLLTAAKSGEAQTVSFSDTVRGTNKNRTPVSSSPIQKSGSAFLTSLTITANNRQTITISTQYTGTGALA